MSFKEDNLESIKKLLSSYTRSQILFNEPRFTNQLLLRDCSREEVINLLLNPLKLIYSYQELGKYGAIKHCLIFELSNNRSLRIPIIFNMSEIA